MRRALLPVVALATVLLCACGTRQPVAQEVDRPDFSGVWFPDAKASGRWPGDRPFTPAMLAAREQWNSEHGPIDPVRDDENLSCIPYTLPHVMTTITQYPLEIVATPQRMWLFTEVFGQVRRIDFAPPAQEEELPSRMGISHAHWEGDELVVETTHILPLHVGHRYAGSPAQRVVERFRLVDDTQSGRRMEVDVTVHDPPVYTEPVTVHMVYKAAPPDVEVGEYICGQDLWDQHRDGSASRIPWR